ncbi:MAG: helix-turn-helix transcriptional regulator [Rhizobiales bacterium]|nr:helix-turn-helix transcriptional regulator [Hyphomicrobiales bacterium]
MVNTTILRDYDSAVRAVYEAAVSPEAWPGAVIIFYRESEPAEFITCPELIPAIEVYQSGGWWKQDLHAQRALALQLDTGDVFHDALVATPREMESHPIYVDFFRKVGLGWLMSCVLLPDLDMLISLSVPRAKAKGPFQAGEIELLARLGRHVEQALRVSLRITGLECENATLFSAVDAVDACLFALDDDGRVMIANAAAARSRDNYFLDGDEALVPQAPDERERLFATLAAAAAPSSEVAPGPCVVTGRDGRRMAMWAIPVADGSQTRVGDGTRLLVFGSALDRNHAIDPSVLRDVFRLSLGEARLASLLGAGMEMREAATRLGVTEGTARIVLKRVFRKLGINRQAQLVQQLSNLRGWGPLGPATSSDGSGST